MMPDCNVTHSLFSFGWVDALDGKFIHIPADCLI